MIFKDSDVASLVAFLLTAVPLLVIFLLCLFEGSAALRHYAAFLNRECSLAAATAFSVTLVEIANPL
jgi:hypothetical protein